MEKRITNPWQWQHGRNYNQAVEVKNASSTLYLAGQAAVNPDGSSSTDDMRSQVLLALNNLETVIREAGYELKNIVRLNVITTSSREFFDVFGIFQEWISRNGIKQTTTLFEVPVLYETLKIEFEATAVR